MSDPTPGPWALDAMGHGSFVVGPTRTEATSHNTVVLNIVARTDWGRGEEDEANARLIAAAPQLLEACELALVWLSRVYPEDVWPGEGDEDSDGRPERLARERCRAAIARAMGDGR